MPIGYIKITSKIAYLIECQYVLTHQEKVIHVPKTREFRNYELRLAERFM